MNQFMMEFCYKCDDGIFFTSVIMEFCYKCDDGFLLQVWWWIFVTSVIMEFCYKCDDGFLLQLWWWNFVTSVMEVEQGVCSGQSRLGGNCCYSNKLTLAWMSEPNIVFLIINLSILCYGGISSNFCVWRKLLFKSNDDVYIKVRGVVGRLSQIVIPDIKEFACSVSDGACRLAVSHWPQTVN